jgi:rubrerythrin
VPVLDEKTLKAALGIQRQEITEYHIYLYLAKICKDQHNAEVLLSVSKAEKDHAAFWMEKTGVSVKPSGFKIGWLNDALVELTGALAGSPLGWVGC